MPRDGLRILGRPLVRDNGHDKPRQAQRSDNLRFPTLGLQRDKDLNARLTIAMETRRRIVPGRNRLTLTARWGLSPQLTPGAGDTHHSFRAPRLLLVSLRRVDRLATVLRLPILGRYPLFRSSSGKATQFPTVLRTIRLEWGKYVRLAGEI